ncbi:MAG: hypothetical protein HC822_24650 [Oscillochloris sp.]|nr:hypothetical protein [Oscillochloris sp.]
MFETETHAMELVQVDAAGTEEWHCPMCGRRFQMRWPPEYAKVVLVPGDEYAIHTGAKGGLQMGEPAVLDAENYRAAPSASPTPEPELSPEVSDLWRRLLRDLEDER